MVALVGALTLTLTSCDECKDVTCDNGGSCSEGTCECTDNFYGDACEVECVNGTYADGTCGCDAGYEGEACDVESRADMIASYSVADVCSASGADSYECDITASSASADGILISDFWAIFVNDVTATVSGDEITIAEQEPDGDGWKVSGSGTYNEDGTIDFDYNIVDPDGNADQCDATWTKK